MTVINNMICLVTIVATTVWCIRRNRERHWGFISTLIPFFAFFFLFFEGIFEAQFAVDVGRVAASLEFEFEFVVVRLSYSLLGD